MNGFCLYEIFIFPFALKAHAEYLFVGYSFEWIRWLRIFEFDVNLCETKQERKDEQIDLSLMRDTVRFIRRWVCGDVDVW